MEFLSSTPPSLPSLFTKSGRASGWTLRLWNDYCNTQFFRYTSSKIFLLLEVEGMEALLSDVTSVSSKGQVVLPKAIRDKLQILPGVKMMVLSDGINILLKPIPEPDITEFQELMDAAASWASSVGMTEEDISTAIKTVRSRKKQSA